jgi:glycosyltransferase involved in cell wall biosynthesis
MKVLHLIPYMHASAGGPPVVVEQWCQELVRNGCFPEILTTDSFAPDGDTAWLSKLREVCPVRITRLRGPAGFGYSSEMKALLGSTVRNFDLVHVHNLWSYENRIASVVCPRYRVPFVVSPHGMLDPHSLSRKAWKKRLYGRIVEWPGLRRAQGLFFTHAEEERLARLSCPGLPRGYVVPLGAESPPDVSRERLKAGFLNQYPMGRDRKRIVFLSRLHPKKGIDLLLPALRQVIARDPHVMLFLVGPGDPGYLNRVKQQIAGLNIEHHVLLTGPLSGVDKWAALAAADVYVLPSYQENFAIALVEALRMGTPAICSQRVNLWNELLQQRAVAVCDLTADSVAATLLPILADSQSADEMGQRARRYAETHFTWQISGDRLREAYHEILRLSSSAAEPNPAGSSPPE